MAAALYQPSLGYYARETRQVGRGGDFFTSVSVGPLFGELLARRFLREWQESGSPARWRIIECGAHDGTLAADILGAISRLDPHAFAALEGNGKPAIGVHHMGRRGSGGLGIGHLGLHSNKAAQQRWAFIGPIGVGRCG